MSSSSSALPLPPAATTATEAGNMTSSTIPPMNTTITATTEAEEEVPLFELYSAYSCMGLDNKNARNDYVYFDRQVTSFLRLSSLFDPNLVNADRPISLLGVVVSYTMIKQCKGSHKYSFTFNVIDPFRYIPSMSVPVILFFNHLEDISADPKLSQSERRFFPTNNPLELYQMHVGDLVIVENVMLQFFNGFPQLIAKEERSRITVVRSHNTYQDGKLINLRDPTHFYQPKGQFPEVFHDGLVLSKEKWSVKSYGKRSAIVNQNISTFFSKVLLKLASWTEHHLKDTSLADGGTVVHHTLDQLYHLIGTIPENPAYPMAHPAIPQDKNFAAFYQQMPNPAPALPSTSSLVPYKSYDGIFLVLEVMYGEGGSVSELVVWDGTSRGVLMPTSSTPPSTLHPLQVKFSTNSSKIKEYRDIIEYATQAPMKYSNNPALQQTVSNPGSSSSSSSSSAAVAPVPGLTQLHASRCNVQGQPVDSRGYVGTPIIIKAIDANLNHFISRVHPGEFIRIRSLHTPQFSPDFIASCHTATDLGGLYHDKAYLLVKNDTHITPLHPYQKDVVTLVERYFQRLLNPAFQKFTNTVAAGTASSSSSSNIAGNVTQGPNQVATVVADSKKRTCNANGDPYCPLEWVWAIPVPAAFSCFGKIVEWYPKQVKDFVKEVRLEDGSMDYVFMCSLRIIDGSSFVDAILYREEAERFFGIHAYAFFQNRQKEQVFLESQLQHYRDHNVVIDMYIKSYSVEVAFSNHGNGNKRKRDPVVEKAKRLAIFSTKAPFALSSSS